jgi:DNA-directed RNA polymerase subunit RPC12/RpoP
MKIKKHNCPICKRELKSETRYPNYICAKCSVKATDINGRKLTFGNISIGGGFKAIYLDTKEIYNSHICFVDNIECYADEARFGGIVVQTKLTDINREELPIKEIESP